MLEDKFVVFYPSVSWRDMGGTCARPSMRTLRVNLVYRQVMSDAVLPAIVGGILSLEAVFRNPSVEVAK